VLQMNVCFEASPPELGLELCRVESLRLSTGTRGSGRRYATLKRVVRRGCESRRRSAVYGAGAIDEGGIADSREKQERGGRWRWNWRDEWNGKRKLKVSRIKFCGFGILQLARANVHGRQDPLENTSALTPIPLDFLLRTLGNK
jgi:hypothetical protein